MKKTRPKLVISLIAGSLVTYVIAYLFMRYIRYPDHKFDIDINVISAVPTICIVAATLLYVVITTKILEENQLERKKTFFEDMIKKMILPILDKLEKDIERFQSHNVFYMNERKCDLNRFKIKNKFFSDHPDVFFKIFADHYFDLSEEIKTYDRKISELEKIYSDIINKIDTEQSRKQWTQNVNNYQEKAKGKDRFSELKTFSKIIERIFESIIKKQQSNIIPDLFWEEYKEEILLERDRIKKEFELLDRKTKEIIDCLEVLKDHVIETIISEQEKHGFLAYG